MSDSSQRVATLPPEQEAIRAKCFHPSGAFEEFKEEDIEQSIPERFEQIVEKYPSRIAVKTKDHQITYDALNRAANRLARAILAARGKSHEPVVLILEHGLLPILANLAVLKAGKMSLQLDLSAPRATIAHILEDSQAALVVTHSKNASMAGEWLAGKKATIHLDELDSNLSDQNLGLVTPPDSYAYVRYTSGSTGQSKGAVKTHRNVLHAVMVATNNFHLCIDDHVSHLGREALGKHVLEALLNGAALYPMDIKEKGMAQLADWLIQEGITSYQSFPTAFRHFASTLTGQEVFPSLRLIRLEGEPLNQGDVALYKKHFSGECLLVNSYSSAETGTVCVYFVDKSFAPAGPHVPVGYPVAGAQVVLLDDSNKPVGFNQPGEIVVRSRFLSSGYWQRSETTREKFRSTPDGGGEEQVYLTGDVGQLSEDGCLQHLGRKDFMVKIRGFRVDIVEVESILADHPGVKQAAVIAREDPSSGDMRVIAYVAPNSEALPTGRRLRDFLQEKLPEYMIPSSFVVLDQLPLTSTGKVDRCALPAPGTGRPATDNPYAAPRTPLEEQVGQIWAHVLSLDQVGIHDNFFDLGGHSLAATRVVSRVIKQFQTEVPLQVLFHSPTVADMAAVIAEHQAKKLGDNEIEVILAELESLTDEEAKLLVAGAAETRHRRD